MDQTNPEIQQFIMQERQKAEFNEVIMKLTSTCWDKCITGAAGNKFSSSESACLNNCARRYLDTTVQIIKRFQGSMQ